MVVDVIQINSPNLSAVEEKSPESSNRLSLPTSITQTIIPADPFDITKYNSDDYEAEKILGIQKEDGEIKLLVKWKDWPYSDATWEDIEDLDPSDLVCIKKFQFRMRVSEVIKKNCRPNESLYYPYHNSLTISDFPQLSKIMLWEDRWNEVCREAGIAPLQIENWIDDECEPPDFRFIQFNQFHGDALKLLESMKMKVKKCKCDGSIESKGKHCSTLLGSKFPYQGSRLLTFNLDRRIIECSEGCDCDANCPSKVVQRGRQIPIVLFRTEFAGWSVRAATFIPEGTFVMTYIGEVIEKQEEGRRGDDAAYMYSVNTVDNSIFTVDSLHQGNEARFVNHSCDPNLLTRRVLIDRYENYETLAFFAIKDIKVGDELTIDYYADLGQDDVLVEGLPCRCGSKKCRGFLKN